MTDYRVQIKKVHEIAAGWGDAVRAQDMQVPKDLSRRGEGPPSVVVGEDVGAELGQPGTVSHAMVLTTTDKNLIEDGRVRCAGPDLDQAAGGAYAQVVMLSHNGNPPDPFELETTQYLPNRLPGFMARTVPGRLWVRFSRQALEQGFRMHTLGSALLAAFRMDFPEVTGAEVLLATAEVEEFDQVAAEFKVLSGRHRKLVLVEDGVYDCEDLDCDSCDQKEVCDALKDITVRYRRESVT